jgi:DNA-binding Lrp family transcriptional regulator
VFFDAVDQKIIEALRKDSRTPFLKIAKSANVSEGCIRKRVKQLKERGIIEAFTVVLNPKLAFEAIVGVKTETKKTKSVFEKICGFGFQRVFEVSGKFDIFCFVSANSSKELNKRIDSIREVDGVSGTETFIVMGKK